MAARGVCIESVRVPLAAAVLLLACAGLNGRGSKAGPDVLAALRAQGRVAVVVALAEPAGYGVPGADAEALRREIARTQREVLARLDAADFAPGQLFENVPALAGTVLTRRGLDLLVADPRVRRVDVDVGGGGSVVR